MGDDETTLSTGNHALALAYHGAELGIPVTVLMPSIAPLTKITKCRALGAHVILEGDSIADAALAAKQYVENDGMKYINGGAHTTTTASYFFFLAFNKDVSVSSFFTAQLSIYT